MHIRSILLLGVTSFFAVVGQALVSAQADLTPAQIDTTLRAEWRKQSIQPAPLTDDARFLRRVSLDLIGQLPKPDEIRAFLAETSPNKREKVIGQLLNDPRYVDFWVNYWDDVLIGRGTRNPLVDRLEFRNWLAEQFRQNAPYNRFVSNLLTATGLNSPGGDYARMLGMKNLRPNALKESQSATASTPPAAKMEAMEREEGSGNTKAAINGAVNWHLKYLRTPADLSGTVSRLFLGVQIQCAQCHDHKTEKWKQDDFRKFTACFMQARALPVNATRKTGLRQMELQDSARVSRFAERLMQKNPENGRAEYLRATPATLDGSSLIDSPNRRAALAEWITAPNNPWFAKAIVNRIWAHFMGRGFVDPIDDFRENNPITLPALLNRLSEDFATHGYDLKRLMRQITTTQAYQLAAAPTTQKGDATIPLWSRYRLKALEPEVILDMLVGATDFEPVLERAAGANLPLVKAGILRNLSFLFDVDEEAEKKEYEGTIPEALLLMNGSLANNAASAIPGAALSKVLAMQGGDAKKIEELYLRTLSRKPTPGEVKRWTDFVNAPRFTVETAPSQEATPSRRGNRQKLPPQQMRRALGNQDPLSRLGQRFQMPDPTPEQQAYEDLFWALLNSSEFLFNH